LVKSRFPSALLYHDRYRTVPRPKIAEMIRLGGFAYEPCSATAEVQIDRALDRWTEARLGVRLDRFGEQLFDPVEVMNFMRQAALDGSDLFWAETYVPTGRRMVEEMATAAKSSFVVDFRRCFHLGENVSEKPLRLRLPLPLKNVHGASLGVTSQISGLTDPHLTLRDDRLEVRSTAPRRENEVTIAITLRFDAPSPARDLNDASPYLKPTEGLVVTSRRIADLASALAGPGASTAQAVRAFWVYIRDELKFGAIHYDQVNAAAPCDWVLDVGWYDCQLVSALLVALCRSRSIPARQVSGYLLYPVSPSLHYWAEVWFADEGWKPFDFMSLDLCFGDTDPAWRDRFYGRIDHRMITQRLPFEFTGAIGVPIPNAWHIMQIPSGDGIAIDLIDLGGKTVFCDVVSVRN
jgi:Transglutaminase-like superfamily